MFSHFPQAVIQGLKTNSIVFKAILNNTVKSASAFLLSFAFEDLPPGISILFCGRGVWVFIETTQSITLLAILENVVKFFKLILYYLSLTFKFILKHYFEIYFVTSKL